MYSLNNEVLSPLVRYKAFVGSNHNQQFRFSCYLWYRPSEQAMSLMILPFLSFDFYFYVDCTDFHGYNVGFSALSGISYILEVNLPLFELWDHSIISEFVHIASCFIYLCTSPNSTNTVKILLTKWFHTWSSLVFDVTLYVNQTTYSICWLREKKYFISNKSLDWWEGW